MDLPSPTVQGTASESTSLRLRLKNFLASALLVVVACGSYAIAPVHRHATETLFGPPSFAITGRDFLLYAGSLYLVCLAIFFLTEASPGVSKSLRFLRIAARTLRHPVRSFRTGLTRDERLAVLATLLKAFFAPLMALILMRMCMGALMDGQAVRAFAVGASAVEIFNTYGFWLAFQVIIFVDVLVFTAGYLIELPLLRNQIRSVDPTIVGWAAALLCYPPFNSITAVIIGSPASEFPQFDDPTLHVVMNVIVLLLMAGFASASVALGFKASNLTHRGIIARGPYALVRHPAYICKNAAWWIGSIPTVTLAFDTSAFAGLQSLGSVMGVTLLYALRALTEEDHLRSVDGEYEAYAAKVRYRFVPGLF